MVNTAICWLTGLLFLLAGCSGGAVVFAPTPLPADLSPLRYHHPSGAFSVSVPRNWPLFVQNTTTLAAAAFSLPGAHEPALSFAVMNLGEAADETGFAALITRYQEQIRPDADHYSEQDREAMGDGSWRMTGLRTLSGGRAQQVNTFIERRGRFVAVSEIIVPEDAAHLRELERAVNTLEVNSEAALVPAEAGVLAAARRTELDVLNVAAWTTADGVFFITGEVANFGDRIIRGLPVRAVLFGGDGRPLAEAIDNVMGYALQPGAFAPFSLRFGEGEAAAAAAAVYEISLGSGIPTGNGPPAVFGRDALSWTDESRYGDDGALLIRGSVTNTGSQTVTNLRAVITVFDSDRRVVAATFVDIAPSELTPGAAVDFQARINEFGGEAEFYIVDVQGLP